MQSQLQLHKKKETILSKIQHAHFSETQLYLHMFGSDIDIV